MIPYAIVSTNLDSLMVSRVLRESAVLHAQVAELQYRMDGVSVILALVCLGIVVAVYKHYSNAPVIPNQMKSPNFLFAVSGGAYVAVMGAAYYLANKGIITWYQLLMLFHFLWFVTTVIVLYTVTRNKKA